jgi:phage tail-like protein
MAKIREERPYSQFNFVVDLGDPSMNPRSFTGGFQEVSGIGMEVTVSEYRNGNDKDNGVRKGMGLNKAADVTLKRGVIGAATLFKWLDDIRNGDPKGLRDVTIILQAENHEDIIEWKLLRARISKCTYGPLNAKGNDVAMEEMVLAFERLEMKEL